MFSPEARLATSDDVERTLGVGAHSQRLRKLVLRAALLLVCGTLVLAAAAMWRARRPADLPRFETATITRADLRATVTATGTLQAVGAVDVGCEVSGRLQRVLVDYNARVTKGELLAEVDPVQLRAEANQAASQVAAAVAGISLANATLLEAKQGVDRAEAQAKLGLLSTKDLEAARATYSRAQASLESAKAASAVADATLKSTNWKLGKTKIVSPIDGIVLTRSVSAGQTLQASFTTPVLFRLASDLSALELHVQVDEADVGRVREGLIAEFHVDAYPERTFASRVESVHNDATQSNNVVTYEAVLSVDNGARLLRPGMTATATIVSESRTAVLLVPNAALRFVPPAEAPHPGGLPPPPRGAPAQPVAPEGTTSKSHVYVLHEGAPAVAFVRTGTSDGKNTELLGDELSPGTPVLIDVLEPPP